MQLEHSEHLVVKNTPDTPIKLKTGNAAGTNSYRCGVHLRVHLKVNISNMGMSYKHHNARLHEKLTHQLDKHLSQQKHTIHEMKAAELAVEKPTVSFRWATAIVLTSGGCMAILLALAQRQNPNTIDSPFHARTLAILGLASIILGCLTMMARRNPKAHHHL